VARLWKDRVVEKPRTFTIQNNPDGTVTLIPAPGVIAEAGTPVNAANLNGLEDDLKTHKENSTQHGIAWKKINEITLNASAFRVDINMPIIYNEFKILSKKITSTGTTAKALRLYIDDDTKAALELSRKMRFVATNEFGLKNNNDFYGFLCGMLSRDYDIDTIFVDGVFNIVDDKLEPTAQLFSKMDSLAKKYNVEFYVNVSYECLNPPEFLKNYIA